MTRTRHLAQANLARQRAPLDSAEMAGFVVALDPVNRVAEASPGFVWRLRSSEAHGRYRPRGRLVPGDRQPVGVGVLRGAARVRLPPAAPVRAGRPAGGAATAQPALTPSVLRGPSVSAPGSSGVGWAAATDSRAAPPNQAARGTVPTTANPSSGGTRPTRADTPAWMANEFATTSRTAPARPALAVAGRRSMTASSRRTARARAASRSARVGASYQASASVG